MLDAFAGGALVPGLRAPRLVDGEDDRIGVEAPLEGIVVAVDVVPEIAARFVDARFGLAVRPRHFAPLRPDVGADAGAALVKPAAADLFGIQRHAVELVV